MSDPIINAGARRPDRKTIERWLCEYVARLLETEAPRVDRNATFDRLGLDSAATAGLTGDLGEWLQSDVDPAVAYDYPTIAELARYLAQEPAAPP